jgi:hypothetical protein
MNRWHDTSYDTAVTTKLFRTAAFAAHHNAGQKMTDETGVQSPEVCADWELREDACAFATLRPGPRLEAYKNGGISADSAYSGQSTASHPPPSEPDAPPDLDPSFEQPTEAPQPANHMTLVNVTTVPGPEPQSSTSASAKGTAGSTANVIDSQRDSQRLGSQVSTPRTSPSKAETALKNLRTDFQAAEERRQAAEVQREAAEVQRHEAAEVQRREDSQLLISALERLTEQVANLAKAFPVSLGCDLA